MFVPTTMTRLQSSGIFQCESVPESTLKSKPWRDMQNEVQAAESTLFLASLRLLAGAAKDEVVQNVYAALDQINDNLPKCANAFQCEEDRDLMFGYVFKILVPYFLQSCFVRMAYIKPRGYAGDFKMMAHIYDNLATGNGALGEIVDSWCLQRPGAVAVRNRTGFVADHLDNIYEQYMQQAPCVKITSMACGPALELAAFVAACKYPDLLRLTCVDIDEDALAQALVNIHQAYMYADVTGQKTNLARWCCGQNNSFLAEQNIIYTVGLTDYFSDKTLIRFIDACWLSLLSGGTFIMGNFAPYPDQIFMSEILNWKLIYRSAEDLHRIFAMTMFGDNITISSEPAGVNLFVTAVKSEVTK